MDNTIYSTLTRQSGLMLEMQSVANNIANASTTGFRREGIVFSEYVDALAPGDPSLSMATANVGVLSLIQGALTQTGGTFDFAIEGQGFFMVEGPSGQFLTRAGSFTPSAEGELSTPDGYRLLDGGGSPIFIPPDATSVSLAKDGTLSIDGRAAALIGLYSPVNKDDLQQRDGVLFEVTGDIEPAFEDAVILQGFVEGSNVDPIVEVARMIEVQRSYELGQQFLEKEDERIRSVLKTVGG